MKEPAKVIYKCISFNWALHLYINIACGSFKTIPNSLGQLPVKNLVPPEAPYD